MHTRTNTHKHIQVAAGAIAELWLRQVYGITIIAWVSSVANISSSRMLETDPSITRALVDQTPVRCPHKPTANAMMKVILKAKANNDSVGGVITCVCRSVPAGLGEPCFDKVYYDICMPYMLFLIVLVLFVSLLLQQAYARILCLIMYIYKRKPDLCVCVHTCMCVCTARSELSSCNALSSCNQRIRDRFRLSRHNYAWLTTQ